MQNGRPANGRPGLPHAGRAEPRRSALRARARRRGRRAQASTRTVARCPAPGLSPAEAVPDTAARLRRLAAPGVRPRAHWRCWPRHCPRPDAPLVRRRAMNGDDHALRAGAVEVAATAAAPGLLILADQASPAGRPPWTAQPRHPDGGSRAARRVPACRAHLVGFAYAPLGLSRRRRAVVGGAGRAGRAPGVAAASARARMTPAPFCAIVRAR